MERLAIGADTTETVILLLLYERLLRTAAFYPKRLDEVEKIMERVSPELVDDSFRAIDSNIPGSCEEEVIVHVGFETAGLPGGNCKSYSGNYQQNQHRVLLADEVGLGKTIIASAVIQKVADWHSAWDDHFKVVYICSNINIANQNCRKLGIPEDDCLDFQESRLSMQHLRIYESAGRDHSYMQLIPMTPATSFSMTGGQGSKHERALIYAVLHRYPAFELYQEPLKQLLQYEHTLQWWDWNIEEYNKRIDECDAETGNYISDMMAAIGGYFNLEPAFLDEILDICKQTDVMELPHRRRREAVNGLRRMFASISLDRLKPDLVIMDGSEIQGFDCWRQFRKRHVGKKVPDRR
jgi:hypothetical protein